MSAKKHRDADELLREILKAEDFSLSYKELLLYVLKNMGGAQGLANAWTKCFKTAQAGSQTQARMLSDVMGGMSKLTSAGEHAIPDDPAALRAKLQQMMDADEREQADGPDH